MIENRVMVRKYCKFNGKWLWVQMFDGKFSSMPYRLLKTFPSSLKPYRIEIGIAEEEERLLAAGWVPVETDKHYTREYKKSVRVISPPTLVKRV